MTAPVFIVHHLEHGRAALAAAEGHPLVLLSPPGAAGYQGVTWWLALERALRGEFPHSPFVAALDCADCVGWALAALRLGVGSIVLSGDGAAHRAARQAAEQKGAWGEGRWGNDSLDLLGAQDPGRSCRDVFRRLREQSADGCDPAAP